MLLKRMQKEAGTSGTYYNARVMEVPMQVSGQNNLYTVYTKSGLVLPYKLLYSNCAACHRNPILVLTECYLVSLFLDIAQRCPKTLVCCLIL